MAAVDPTGVLIAVITAAVLGLAVIAVALRFAKRNNIYIVTFVVGIVAIVIGALASFASL